MPKSSGEQSVYLRGSGDPKLRLPTKADLEGARLNTQHRFLAAVAGKRHYFAPVKNPKAILDVASGTGIWGVDMARHFQQAVIDNVDSNQDMAEAWLSFFTAHHPEVRKRVRVVEADALKPLPFADDRYDFTHGRFLEVFVPYEDWPRMVCEMLRVTKPEGWMELVGGGSPEGETPAYTEVRAAVQRFLGSLHVHPHAAAHYAEWLRAAGAEQIGHRVMLVGKRAGERVKLAGNLIGMAQALRGPLAQAGVLAPERLETLLPQMRQEIIESELVWPVRVCWGRKPRAIGEGAGEGSARDDGVEEEG